jgi:hypothetical protein
MDQKSRGSDNAGELRHLQQWNQDTQHYWSPDQRDISRNEEWIGGFTLAPNFDHQIFVAPKAKFTLGASYNFTFHTTSGKSYSFVLTCGDANVYAENLTVLGWYPLHEDDFQRARFNWHYGMYYCFEIQTAAGNTYLASAIPKP